MDTTPINNPPNGSHRRSEPFSKRLLDGARFVVEIVGLFLVVCYVRSTQHQVALSKAANKLMQDQFKAAQRAFVIFGSPEGKLAELCDVNGYQFAKLFFFNAGNTPARHLAIHAFVSRPDRATQEIAPYHRHRWVSATGQTDTTGLGVASDLGAKAERTDYIIKNMEGLTPEFLKQHEIPWADSHRGMGMDGELEYCDVFGQYHCESFSIYYNTDLNDFVPELGSDKGCRRGTVPPPKQTTFFDQPVSEIEPCEQPNEPDYEKENWEHFKAIVAAKRSSPTAEPPKRP